MGNSSHSLLALSPLDGRYAAQTTSLSAYFSEMALMKYRCRVEIEYFIALSRERQIKEFPRLTQSDIEKLRRMLRSFSLSDARQIKQIEKTVQHDVKAIEYFLRNKIKNMRCAQYSHFLHFAITSEDTNTIAYTLMWRDALKNVFVPTVESLIRELSNRARRWSALALLSLTHGQSASPTTMGKEFAVYCSRLRVAVLDLKSQKFTAKLNGATGTWAAHMISYPAIDWIKFSAGFVRAFGLIPNQLTTQVEGADSLAQSFHALSRINTILIDLCRDMWLYCMRGIFILQRVKNEVGSSTMPHKVNPIHFENAEGNLMLANALLSHLAATVPVSRLQRDLSGSTLIRNNGVALGYSLIACQNVISGLKRIGLDKVSMARELNQNWQVLSEPLQTLLRATGNQHAYDDVKKKTRGLCLTKQEFARLIDSLPLTKKHAKLLKSLTPESYIGLSKQLSTLNPIP